METENAQKVSAIYDAIESAVDYLSDVLSDISSDCETIQDRNTDTMLKLDYRAFKKALGLMSDSVERIKKFYDAEDEQRIETTVLEIQGLLYGVGEPPIQKPIPNQPAMDAMADEILQEDIMDAQDILAEQKNFNNMDTVSKMAGLR